MPFRSHFTYNYFLIEKRESDDNFTNFGLDQLSSFCQVGSKIAEANIWKLRRGATHFQSHSQKSSGIAKISFAYVFLCQEAKGFHWLLPHFCFVRDSHMSFIYERKRRLIPKVMSCSSSTMVSGSGRKEDAKRKREDHTDVSNHHKRTSNSLRSLNDSHESSILPPRRVEGTPPHEDKQNLVDSLPTEPTQPPSEEKDAASITSDGDQFILLTPRTAGFSPPPHRQEPPPRIDYLRKKNKASSTDEQELYCWWKNSTAFHEEDDESDDFDQELTALYQKGQKSRSSEISIEDMMEQMTHQASSSWPAFPSSFVLKPRRTSLHGPFSLDELMWEGDAFLLANSSNDVSGNSSHDD